MTLVQRGFRRERMFLQQLGIFKKGQHCSTVFERMRSIKNYELSTSESLVR